jgi:hypothetical protein
MLSFSPSPEWQKMQVEYMRDDEDSEALGGLRPNLQMFSNGRHPGEGRNCFRLTRSQRS